MGFFYGKAQSADEYLSKINAINSVGVPKAFVGDIELLWATCLRLTSYNPLEAKKILNNCDAKQIYEAYVMYHFDNFPDA